MSTEDTETIEARAALMASLYAGEVRKRQEVERARDLLAAELALWLAPDRVAVASVAALFHAYIGIAPDASIPGLSKDVRRQAEALLTLAAAAEQGDAEGLRKALETWRAMQ